MARIFSLLALLLMLMGCKAGYVSIEAVPVPLPAQAEDILNRPAGLTLDYTKGDLKTICPGEFVSSFYYAWRESPAAVVVWSDERKRPEQRMKITSTTTWREAIGSFSKWGGDCTPTTHPGFLELAWASPHAGQAVRKEMTRTVPPICMRAPNPAQFMTLWHGVSGENFKYDRRFVTRLWPSEVRMRKDDDSYGYSRYNYYEELNSPLPEPHEKFMNLLAAKMDGAAWMQDGEWIIGRYEDAPSDEVRIQALLARIKAVSGAPFTEEEEVSDPLVKYGAKALPAVLEEFRRPHEGGIIMSLTWILSKMPSPDRDDAFIASLENLDQRKDERFSVDFFELMLDSLAENKCAKALPLLRKMASNRIGTRPVYSHVITTLNVLDEPQPPRPTEAFLDIAPTTPTLLKQTAVKDALPALIATLDQVFQPSTSTLILTHAKPVSKIEVDESILPELIMPQGMKPLAARLKAGQGCHCEFSGSFMEHTGSWGLSLSLFDDEALVIARFTRGPLWGSGYMGRLVKRNSRWLVVEWKNTWIS